VLLPLAVGSALCMYQPKTETSVLAYLSIRQGCDIPSVAVGLIAVSAG
jgi:hypothetical protein